MPELPSAHRRYYTRNRGDWDWSVRLRIQSWSQWWSSQLPWTTKLPLGAVALGQRLIGDFRLWTQVEFDGGGDRVEHRTVLRKWGLTLYRSEETMTLADDGRGLRVEGKQFRWPRLRRASTFGPFAGHVEEDSVRAFYAMEMLGAPCRFTSVLDGDEGIMRFEGDFVVGHFLLTEACRQRLRERRRNEVDDQ